MIKYWYVTQDKQGTYLVGFCYGRNDAEETQVVDAMRQYCVKKQYKLVLLIQLILGIPIVNQVWPYHQTEETRKLLPTLIQAAYNN